MGAKAAVQTVMLQIRLCVLGKRDVRILVKGLFLYIL